MACNENFVKNGTDTARLMFGTLTWRWMTCGTHVSRIHISLAPRYPVVVRQGIPVRMEPLRK
jgi:hypothetical protein